MNSSQVEPHPTRVSTRRRFLLLKQFGFPWFVLPLRMKESVPFLQVFFAYSKPINMAHLVGTLIEATL